MAVLVAIAMAASADPLANITTGYPKLAARIEIQPQLSIYRRFGALNAQNILYLQAQLIDLETKLRTQQSRDDTNPQGKKALYAKTWYRLENSASDGDTKQLDLVLKTRQVLSEFSELRRRRLNPREIQLGFSYALRQTTP